MKNLLVIIILLGLFSCNKRVEKNLHDDKHDELTGVQNWFDAWELVAENTLKLNAHEPPLMLFFDDEFLYSNSKAAIANGIEIKGPRFFDKELNWFKVQHNDSLLLPTGDKVPVGLMSFTASISEGSEDAFFIMGLPSFWKDAKVTSEELGDDNLYTSVFLHEFAHSQQNKIFGVRLDQLDRDHKFNFELSDDMIQEDFETDSTYVNAIKAEIAVFYNAFQADDNEETKRLTAKGLDLYNKRQEKYFIGEREIYRSLDDFFLTMEGIGQYVAFAWLTDPKGGNIEVEPAVQGIRRGGKWWSQDESLALFLVYNKLSTPELGKEMFGADLNKINVLLENQMK